MAAFINTNIASLNAQRNLTASQGALQTSLQRLSSGLRINSAKDDAAGLAIADRFSTQIRGVNQAVRNANDGISLSQTAEGALGEMGNNLQRIRELAVQAANSTNSASDRAAINEEVQQRLAEIDRTSSQTSFNGQKILDGSFGSANFQIGANAGETIQVNLETSMRNASIGKIATTTTTGVIGASTGGSVAVEAATRLFGTAASAGTGGTLDVASTNLNYGTAGTPQVDGTNVQSLTAYTQVSSVTFNADYSGVGASLDFSVGGQAVSLAGDYTNGAANTPAQAMTAFLADLNGQLTGITATGDSATGAITFTRDSGIATSTTTVAISGSNAAANAAGITDTAGKSVYDFSGTGLAQFDVGGQGVTLNAAYADQNALLTAINDQLTGIDATANVNGEITFTNTGSTTAVAVSGSDANAQLAGFGDSAGTAGSAAIATTNASFDVDGTTVTLNANYADQDAVATAIQTALGNSYTVDNNAGTISITNNAAGSAAVTITNADANATAGGFANATGTAGDPVIQTTNATFEVDTHSITLDDDFASFDAMAAEIQAQLDAAAADTYTVANDNGSISVTRDSGTAAIAITNADSVATSAGFANTAGTAGVVGGGAVTLTNLTIQAGNGNSVTMAGTFDTAQELADAINKDVSNVYASVSSGQLTLTSAAAITLGGSDSTTLGFASNNVAASNGSLTTANTLTTSAALDTIQRIDSALNSVNSLRSTFGAVQNRFESVISNLSSTSENLSAARSRIQDADFAAETASLTRGQILQQAGTAMLAQANSLPNGVLALLRG